MSAPIAINVAQSASSSPASSPRLYVPIHKRAGSTTSSSSSSRPSSPSSTSDTSTYSIATLLSLRPLADEGMKGKVQVTCPEIVLSRKTRKGLEFNGRRELLSAPQLSTQASPTPALDAPAPATRPKAEPTLQPSTAAPLRVLPRRTRPAGRAPERRRNAFGTRRGLATGDESWRLHTIPMSSVLLV